MIADYIIHFIIGLGGAGIGLLARNWCSHRRHQIIVGVLAVAIESAVTVPLVG
jgi:hypothetical protein